MNLVCFQKKKKKNIRLLEHSSGESQGRKCVSIPAPNLILFGKQIAVDVVMRSHWLQGASCASCLCTLLAQTRKEGHLRHTDTDKGHTAIATKIVGRHSQAPDYL